MMAATRAHRPCEAGRPGYAHKVCVPPTRLIMPRGLASVGRGQRLAGMPYYRTVRPALSRPRRTALTALVAIMACLACGGPTASGTPSASPTTAAVRPSPSATTSSTPTPSPAATPISRPSPTPTPQALPPTAAAFWAAVQSGLRSAGKLEVSVSQGRVAYAVQYTPAASASLVEGQRIFVCRDGHAYDGQSAWVQAPGTYTCGGAALQDGFQESGQPVDSWGRGSGVDQSIKVSVTLAAGGQWRWTYRSVSPLSGDVRTVLTLDPRTMRLRSGVRTDATGSATYGFRYAVGFSAIVVPRG